ncbi:hypothetical protein K438DRAFT_2108763 [Mycena galopus ATCC 62051]|nr:hypothetical protein K438DRAFT_2108763 [Mycena galopus ATCC 62051]
MKLLPGSFMLLLRALLGHSQEAALDSSSKSPTCRNIPGSPGFPNAAAWDALNATVSGRLVNVVPSAKFCHGLPSGACTPDQWESALFRVAIPGAMDQNGTTCGQGDVPIYAVEAETVEDIQAAVKFSSIHNLRVVIKSSGHDYLGRSTTPSSLLIHTHKLQNISFTDSFFVGSEDMGSTVTPGSGVYAQTLYEQEFQIVVASGQLLQVNQNSYPDLFYALRGGGAGSWGVIVSATYRTYPTFNATSSSVVLLAQNVSVLESLATLHAQHIFDLDSVHGSQYLYIEPAGTTYVFILNTYMPNTTAAQSTALLASFFDASLALPGVSMLEQETTYGDINDVLYEADDRVGLNVILGSRLIPASTYRDSPATVGNVIKQLAETNTSEILVLLVAGGKVAENANISSAVHPAWRTAKPHFVLANAWDDSASLEEINQDRRLFQNVQLPILEQIAGPNAGSYSNEADVLEPDFQTTFFGPNYAKLSAIKSKYDPDDLFIVGAGVGSERWDEWGLCKV